MLKTGFAKNLLLGQLARHELHELPQMLYDLSGRAQSKPMAVRLLDCARSDIRSYFALSTTNKKSLPKGKPFIGEHRFDAST